MTEDEILKYCLTKHDSKGRFLARLVKEDIYNEIIKLSPSFKILERNYAITAFYSGYRRVPICLNDNCNAFTNWRPALLNFSKYCCTKCSNSDPKKDEITVKNNLEKYGVPRASMTEESKAKLIETNLERFGCISSAQHQSVKDKALATNLERYGHISTEIGNIKNLKDYNDDEFIITNFIKNEIFLKNEFMDYFNCGQVAAHNTLNRLNIKYKKFGSLKQTYIERLFEEFLIDENIKFISHYRDKYEIDFYLPDHNIGIELDGLYFHSYGINGHYFKESKEYYKYKHINKKKYFAERNIQVLFIWENEILFRFEIWKSIIRSKLNLIKNKIFARKCKIIEVNEFDKKNFLKDNHIQGSRVSSINIGLEYNNSLVAIMTFGKSILNKNYEYELIRFATKLNYTIVGGASKILKYFEKKYNPQSIVTFLNLRWSTNNLKFYPKLGFKFINLSEPNKFILDKKNFLLVKNRLQFQKHKLKFINGFNFNENLTADENIIENGYRIIWDCGNYSYIKLKEINE